MANDVASYTSLENKRQQLAKSAIKIKNQRSCIYWNQESCFWIDKCKYRHMATEKGVDVLSVN